MPALPSPTPSPASQFNWTNYTALPFLVYGCFALTLLIFELRRLHRRVVGRDATSRLFPYAYPLPCSVLVCVLAWGTALDNARIFVGGFDPSFSDGSVMRVVTYLCFFVHDVLLPPVLIVPTELMLATLTTRNESWSQTTVRDLARLGTAAAVVGLTLLGLDHFLDKVADELEVTTTEFPRPFHEKETFVMHSWGLTAKTTPLDLLGVMMLSGWSLVCSAVVTYKLRWPVFFVLQVAALAGQAAGQLSATYFFFASNFFEQVFVLSFVWAEARLWDNPTALGSRATIQAAGGGHPRLPQTRPVSVRATQGDHKEDRMRSDGPSVGFRRSRTTSDATDDDVFHDVSTGETPRTGIDTLQDPLLASDR